ncbi:N-acetylmuramoyl-L-alanine amidase [Paludifilum halophilum]|nr:N-acetylmuramoyl-L-alanine amidase [Paludifilum halophilum]
MSIQVVDPGHGGYDPGCSGNGLEEKDLTLDISRRVCQHLEAKYKTDAKMTRLSDKYISLQGRCDFANRLKAGSFLSVHINAGGGTGFESYVVPNAHPDSAGLLQKNVHKHMGPILKKYDHRDRGKKKANFHVIRVSRMKACLVEIGFIDTDKDAKLLKSDAFLDDVAEALADAIADTEGLEKKVTEPKPEPDPDPEDTFFRVVAGSFQKKDNAEQRVKELEEKGFDAFIDAKH